MRISDTEGLKVIGRKGKVFGRIEHVLFAPTEPRVVGFEVHPPALGYVIDRKPRYLMLAALERSEDGFAIREEHQNAKPDFSWDDSVVWRYMPVVSDDGRAVGVVKDVDFSLKDGLLKRLWITRGVADEVAVGGASLEADEVVGFDGEAVRLRARAAQVKTTGGTARQAGHGAAIAKLAAAETAKQAVGGAVTIARAVRKGEVTKKVAGGWKRFTDSIAEGMREEE